MYKYITFSLFFVLFIGVSTDFMDFSRPKTLRIYQLKGKCPGYEKAPIYWRDIKFVLSNRTYYIYAKIIVQRNLKNGLKLDLNLKRCQARDALDSCENYQGIHINHLCKLINNEHTPWAPFVNLMKPSISCPLQKGVYVVNNGTFDGTAMNSWPLAEFYWKSTIKVLDDVTDEVLMCIYMEAQVAPI